jgi:hypothetical protein
MMRAAEAAAHLLRRGIGGDVEVLGRHAGEQVAHRAADDIGLVAILLQGFDGAPAATADLVPLQAVLGDGDDRRLPVLAGAFSSEDAGYELADHRW